MYAINKKTNKNDILNFLYNNIFINPINSYNFIKYDLAIKNVRNLIIQKYLCNFIH